ncbi:hypothetical protein J6590_010600 [Homalodisca vitripennis]|nr:hypothetical protein J6590_010600 [Homalodisca vitripennis]
MCLMFKLQNIFGSAGYDTTKDVTSITRGICDGTLLNFDLILVEYYLEGCFSFLTRTVRQHTNRPLNKDPKTSNIRKDLCKVEFHHIDRPPTRGKLFLSCSDMLDMFPPVDHQLHLNPVLCYSYTANKLIWFCRN